MISEKEKYSVLMSVYHKEKPEYLEMSISSMLQQTVKPDEFIIIKDGPLTEVLDNVIKTFAEKDPGLFTIITNEKNLGLGPSLAKGVLASKNELIARMDSDDFSAPERCEMQLAMFSNDPDLGMVGTFEAEFSESIENVTSIHKVPETNEEIKQFMKTRNAVLHPTVMYKKSAVLKSGNYRSYYLYEDYDLFARMVLQHEIKTYNIQESLYFIRTGPDFFKRRGGLKYAQTGLSFEWFMFTNKFIGIKDFCIGGIGRFIVSLLPNKIREFLYMSFLRN